MLKRAVFLMLLASPALAETQPIILTPQEYEQVVQALAQRDPLVAFLMQKEQAAQAAAEKATKAEKPSP